MPPAKCKPSVFGQKPFHMYKPQEKWVCAGRCLASRSNEPRDRRRPCCLQQLAGPQDTPAPAPHMQRWRSDPSEGETKVCQLFSLAAPTWAPPANASRRAAFSGTAVRVGVLVSVCRMDEVAGKETFCCDTAVGWQTCAAPAEPELPVWTSSHLSAVGLRPQAAHPWSHVGDRGHGVWHRNASVPDAEHSPNRLGPCYWMFPTRPTDFGGCFAPRPPHRARHLQAESESAVCEERRELWDDSDTPSRLASWLLPHCPTSR